MFVLLVPPAAGDDLQVSVCLSVHLSLLMVYASGYEERYS